MRPLDEWDATDLALLVSNQVQEGLQLDYKRSDALAPSEGCKKELSKDVSAFANSAGGRIIYGISETGHLPTAIDQGSDPSNITREWLEQVINSRIQPRVSGIKIKPIPLTSGHVAYVIDIPQATTFAPHQADNHRYYRRYNFQSVPMEDYEVKDAMRRSAVASPYLRLSWTPEPPDENNVQRARLCFSGGNLSSEPIMYALVKLMIDTRLVPDTVDFLGWEIRRDLQVQVGNAQLFPVVVLTRKVMPNSHMPFFKETEWLLADAVLPIPQDDQYVLNYEFTAPGVDRKVGGMFRINGYEITTQDAEAADMLNAGL